MDTVYYTAVCRTAGCDADGIPVEHVPFPADEAPNIFCGLCSQRITDHTLEAN